MHMSEMGAERENHVPVLRLIVAFFLNDPRQATKSAVASFTAS
jgi:hypothetical protein